MIKQLFGGSILKESGLKLTVATAGYILSSYFQPLRIVASIMYSSAITDCTSAILQDSQEWLTDTLDYYGYDEYIDSINPILDIGMCLSLRRLGAVAIDSLPMKEQTQQCSSSTSEGILSTIQSIFNIGKNRVNNSNIITHSLNITSDSILLAGLAKVGLNLANIVTKYFLGNKDALSVYDIKNILKTKIFAEKLLNPIESTPHIEYNRLEVQAQAEEIYSKIQQSDQYYHKNSQVVQKKIDIVTNLYFKNLGTQLKSQYATVLADNQKLFEKSEVLIEKLMMCEVTSRLLNANVINAELKQINAILPKAIVSLEQIKKIADIQLNEELKYFVDSTSEEQQVYKDLFFRSTIIACEYELKLPYITSMSQYETNITEEF